MIIGEKIKQMLKERGVSAEYLAAQLGVTATTVFSMYKKDSVESKHIEKMTQIFDLPLSYFFNIDEASVSGDGNLTNAFNNVRIGGDLKNVGTSKKNNATGSDCEHLERLLAEKERVIQLQQELIESLKNR